MGSAPITYEQETQLGLLQYRSTLLIGNDIGLVDSAIFDDLELPAVDSSTLNFIPTVKCVVPMGLINPNRPLSKSTQMAVCPGSSTAGNE